MVVLPDRDERSAGIASRSYAMLGSDLVYVSDSGTQVESASCGLIARCGRLGECVTQRPDFRTASSFTVNIEPLYRCRSWSPENHRAVFSLLFSL